VRRLPPSSIDWLLVFLPVSAVADFFGQTLVVFIASALAIVPIAGLIGRSTEQLAIRLGPRQGALLNATLGNITELIVAVLLINAGNFAIVKASLIGSILGNLLLVLGISFAVGGLRDKSNSSALVQQASTRRRSCLLSQASSYPPFSSSARRTSGSSRRKLSAE